MANPVTLSQLLVAVTADQEKARLLSGLASKGFPITDWAEGGVERTILESESAALSDLSELIPAIAAGGFLSSSTSDWLTLLAHELYELDRFSALSTIGREVLRCVPTAGPYTIVAGQLSFKGAGGNIYFNTSGGVLKPPGFSSVTHVGAGAGTLVPSASSLVVPGAGQLAPLPVIASANGYSYVVTIDVTGAAGGGVARFHLNYLNASGASVPSGLGEISYVVPNGTIVDPLTGLVMTFAGNFVQGDTYSFTSGGELDLTARSEHPNDSANGLNYIDASNTVTNFVTPLPGVTVSNPSQPFTVYAGDNPGIFSTSGSTTGSVRLLPQAWSAVPINTFSIVVITGGLPSGGASFSYSVNGIPVPGIFAMPGFKLPYTDATLNAANVSFTFDSTIVFQAGDIYGYTIPQSWVVQQGTDQESDTNLVQRCAARWPSLSQIPTQTVWELWARQASPQVTKVFVGVDPAILNLVDVSIAGQSGGLPENVRDQVQFYLNQRAGLTERPVVNSITTTPINLLNNIVKYRASSSLAAIQSAVQAAVVNYVLSVSIGPSLVRTVDMMSAIATGAYSGQSKANPVLTSGVVDVLGPNGTPQDFRINGAVGNFSVTLQFMAIYLNLVSSELVWVPV